MKAAVLKEFDTPLVLEDVPTPDPGPGQVLVRVAACGVCHSDVHMARGHWEGFKSLMPLPIVLGHEVAGTVESLGAGVTQLQEGDRVGIPWFHHTCGECEYCRSDLEVFCINSAITGVTVNGGFAEFALAWESHVVPIPDNVSLVDAAPLFCAGGTVYSALKKVRLDGSKKVGVWGTGGLGLYGIQLAKLSGAHVTAIDRVESKFPAAREAGADTTVSSDTAGEWFSDPTNKLDVVLVSATSVAAYQGAFDSLRRSGTLLVVGLPSEPLSWTAGALVRSGTRIVPSRVCSRRELGELMTLAANKSIRGNVRRYTLAQAEETIELVSRGEINGRAVCIP